MNWKQAVAEIISKISQMLVDGEGKLPEQLFRTDDETILREMARIHRFRQGISERKATPLKIESAISFLNINENVDEANADVLVRHCFFYEQSKLLLSEEYYQYYDVSCKRQGDHWVIESWVPTETPSNFHETIPDNSFQEQNCNRSFDHWYDNDLFRSKRAYDRAKAVRYAETWWNGHNPRYLLFADDCTNFISQCLHAGGLPMESSNRRDRGWWYRGSGRPSDSWSFSWTVANSLYWYLKAGKGTIPTVVMSSPDQLTLGDVICYDFDGDGRWQHNTIVTGFDRDGMPLVNAHTNNSRMRYWDYKDSYAWTEQTKYAFFHIAY